jgi:hypothetical protein
MLPPYDMLIFIHIQKRRATASTTLFGMPSGGLVNHLTEQPHSMSSEQYRRCLLRVRRGGVEDERGGPLFYWERQAVQQEVPNGGSWERHPTPQARMSIGSRFPDH